jgi:hypothetical protein
MRIGRFVVGDDTAPLLEELLDAERCCPYRGGGGLLTDRIARALEVLDAHELDTDLALRLLGRIRYLDMASREQAWRTVWSNLSGWLTQQHLDPSSQCCWIELKDENHINEVWSANGLAQRREVAQLRDTYTLWQVIRNIIDRHQDDAEISALALAAEQPVWVYFGI